MKKQTWIAILIVSIVIILGIGIGVKVKMDKKNSNLEKQRTAGKGFIKNQPGISKIKFMQDGSYSGAGVWSVGVNVYIGEKKYKEIFVENGLMGGETLPDKDLDASQRVNVIYSDGRKEILK
ncbi:hypothetical protein LG542_08255 [Latilactobacillus graminis]|nr:hypothetical protein [Latilactobacillus graminis]QFP80204.1 hypothetical protein LG542_08255 [Latilactobacillus graminis]